MKDHDLPPLPSGSPRRPSPLARGRRLFLALAALGAACLASPAQAAWTYAGGTLNAAETYDGAGVDVALNPRTQGVNTHSDYIGSGGTGSITVSSGSLTIVANDFKFGRNNNPSHGTLTVASGATFRIEQTNQWGGGIGVAGNNANVVTGTFNIAGAMTWFLSGSSEQNMTIGSGGANVAGTINLNGGTLVFELDSAQAITSNSAGLRVGTGTAGRGTINLNSGLMTIRGNLPFALGGQWTATASTPVFSDTGTNAGVGLVTVNNGSLECLGSSLFAIGTDDYINFIAGGSGSVSILGWNEASDPGYTKFKALIDAGKIRLNGAAVPPGDYSGFVLSSNGSQGVISAVNNLVQPLFIDQPDAASRFVGESYSFVAEVAGNPAPTLHWEKSADGGSSWSAVSGATSATLPFAPLAYADNGLYRLVAANSQGTVNSNEVALTVTYPNPVITTAPVSQTVLTGDDVTLVVAATGLGSLTYQWQKNGTDIPAQTGVSLALPDVTADSAGVYSVVVSDHAAEADALPATTTTVVAAVGVLDVPAPSRAISLNFVGAAVSPNSFGGATDLGLLDPADSAGILPLANWNNSASVSGVASLATPLALVDNTGASTSVSATWSSANTWAVLASQGAATAKTAAGRLLHGYIERRATATPGNASVALAQIPYGAYDVYVYFTGGTAGAVGKVTVNGADASALYYKAPGAALGLAPTYVQGSATDLASAQALAYNANFVRFAGLSGASLSVAVADAVSGANAGGIAGISIVDTTPAGSAYPPLVASAPADLLLRGGADATFAVQASSLNPGGVISYQWSKDGAPLSGATSSTLVIPDVEGAHSGVYSVVVTDTSSATGSPTTSTHQARLVVVDASRPALLNVDFGPAATSALGSGLMRGEGVLRVTGIPESGANSGAGAGLDNWNGLVGAAGTVAYQGLTDSTGLALAGVTLSVSGVTGVVDSSSGVPSLTDEAGPLLRDLVFTNTSAAPITCTVAGLTDFVGKKVTLVVYAVGVQTTALGNPVNDSATVALDGGNNYLSAPPVATSNAEGRDLAFNPQAYAAFEGIVSPSGAVSWTVGPDADWSSEPGAVNGSIPLNGFQLLLTDADAGIAPIINTQPVSATRLAGLSATFTAGVAASPAPSLQWQKSADGVNGWTDIPGATSTSHATPVLGPDDGAAYRLVATNSAGAAISDVAVLTVQHYPLSASRGISVNWQRDGGTLLATEVAGVVGLAQWDNRTAATATFSALRDSTGEPTATAIQLGAGGNWRSFTAATDMPMRQLFKGYWDFAPGSSSVGATGVMTVTGVTYTSYDVYVYFVTDAAGGSRTARISVNDGAPRYAKIMGSGAAAPVPDYMAEAAATTAETAVLANYVKVAGLTGPGFTVSAVKVDGNYGIAGIQIINTGVAAPAAPSDLAASGGDASVALDWGAVAGATGYNVYRSSVSGGPYVRIAAGVVDTAYADTGLTNGAAYYYVVKAVNAGGAGAAYSNEVSVTPGASLSPIESWRQTHFFSPENSGQGADAADPDGDGLPNLLEYAFGENPTLPNDGPSLQLALSGGVLELSFVHIDDPALSYVVEASGDLSGSWTVAQTYSGYTEAGVTTHADTVPLGAGVRRFLRVRVSLP